MFSPTEQPNVLELYTKSQPHEKPWVVILENILLFRGNNLSLLKSEETLLLGRNEEFIYVSPDCKI